MSLTEDPDDVERFALVRVWNSWSFARESVDGAGLLFGSVAPVIVGIGIALGFARLFPGTRVYAEHMQSIESLLKAVPIIAITKG